MNQPTPPALSWEAPGVAPTPRWESLAACVRARAAERPGDLALFELAAMERVHSPLTYADLDRRIRAVAARLQAVTEPGDRVLLVMPNDLTYIIGFFACAYAGCVAVNLLPATKPKHVARVAHVARDCEARAIFASGARAEGLRARLMEVAALRELAWLRVDEIPEAAARDWRPFSPDGESLCYLQYTSGSTGDPRGVMVSHGNLAAQCAYMVEAFGFTPEDRGLNWMPLYHDLGLIIGVLLPLYTGFPAALTDPLSFIKHPDRYLRAISDHRISFAGGPNFCFDLCMDVVRPGELEGIDLSCWAVALNGAEPLRARTLERFAERFGHLGWRAEAMQPTYGLAEFTLVVATSPRGAGPVVRTLDADALGQGEVQDAGERSRLHRAVSSGRPGPGCSVAVVDPDTGSPQGPGRVGEIWVNGPSIALGYWSRPELSEETFRARLPGDPRPWLRTGDLGFVEDGEVFITGRHKDVVIVAGANHYPQDIEETVEAAHPALRPHFSTVFADLREDRERLVVVAEIRRAVAQADPAEGGLDEALLDELAARIFRDVAREHEIQVDEVHLVHHGQVPKTTSGKLQRWTCRNRLREGELRVHAAYGRGGRL